MSSVEPPWPLNEPARIDRLKSYCILDTPPEPVFDRLTRLAARAFRMPTALVSLVDEGRQWFKARHGLQVQHTTRRLSFCAYTILEDRPMVVPDALADERFAENDLVTAEPYIRFYAGAPLRTPDGLLLGTFCVIDYVPRHDFGEQEQSDLVEFARIVMHELEMRTAQRAAEAAEQAERQARAATERAETRYRAVVETAVDAMVVIDEAGVMQSFNVAAERIFGYAAEDMIGHNVSELMPEPDRSRHKEYIGRYLQTGIPRIIGSGREVEGRRRDGTVFPLELAIAEWWDGRQRFFTGIMRDLTQRHTIEQKLQQSNMLFRTLIEGITDPVFVKDANGRFLVVNDATCRLFAADHDQVLGARDRDFYPPKLASHIEAVDRQVIESGEVVVLEEEILDRTNGEIRICLTTKAPLRATEGRVIGVLGIARDITERKRFEDSLRAAKSEAERANVAKSKFLASASHDLRQPVQSLVLFMGALQGHVDGSPAIRILRSMEQSLNGLRMLLDGLLDVSKLDAGLVTAKPVTMPLAPIIQRLADEYILRAAELGLRFRTSGCGVVVKSDPVLLERILRNLVENALRYTERGGVLVGCRRRGSHLRIEVADTGIGIAADRQQEVFDEFFQVGNPERDRSKGLGLGLAVVRRLARLLGHEVEVRSIPGRGSTFAVTVPLMGVVSGSSNLGETSVPEESSGVILVIDDEELVRAGMQAMIETWGYRVLAGACRQDAVRMLKDNSPDILLADYRLRDGETGLDVIKAVHARLGKRIPAAIITGDTAPERLAEAQAGGYRLLHKPVAAADLRMAVVELMGQAMRPGDDLQGVDPTAPEYS
ncbi:MULTISPECIES: PAS domain S-box protein [unclassified Azospirillum]|uniref:hybrid sensor histidine kinase/response regulator n=1 Tax=unclassified Azospirillum TaxID=2630922 RepID=UPI000D651B34|nr:MULTISPECIES: PAS domain S-box protein [unclassified Azospirillum]